VRTILARGHQATMVSSHRRMESATISRLPPWGFSQSFRNPPVGRPQFICSPCAGRVVFRMLQIDG